MRDKADAVRTADAAVATKQREVDAMIIPEFKAQKETELAATKQEAENRKTELQIATDQAVATKKRLETDQADAKRLESIRATALEAHKITPLDGQVPVISASQLSR